MPSAPLTVERLLPDPDGIVRRHLVVDHPPRTVLATATDIDLADLARADRVMRPLFAIRGAFDGVARRVRRDRGPEIEAAGRLRDLPEEGDWVALGGEPGVEVAFGAVGRFWGPRVEFDRIRADAFADIAPPGRAKIVASLQARPYGAGSALLTYEVRTAATDKSSRKGLLRYWRVTRPFVAWTMSRLLAAVGDRLDGLAVPPEQVGPTAEAGFPRSRIRAEHDVPRGPEREDGCR